MIITEKFEKVDTDKLIPYARNARTHSKEQINQLRSSMREFGFVNPVIVDKDLNIIAGHGRVLAAKEEKLTQVPCIFVEHLTDAQKKAYILADNRLALNAGWDEEMLSVELSELMGDDFDLSLLGFDGAEIDKPRKNGDHPTMKPIPLLAYPILNSSLTNCIVLDAFGGSGSTLIACEQTDRICYMIELDEKFCDVIVKRYIEQVGSAENVFVVREGENLSYSSINN